MGYKQVDERGRRRSSPLLVSGVIPSQLAALVYLTAVALVADISGISAAAQPTSKSGYACEGLKLSLKCAPGEVIRIHLANYGRFTLTVCNDRGQTDGWDLQCRTPKAKDIVSERCDGRRTCEVPADSNVFPEPCQGTYKYLEVKYMCERETPDPPHPPAAAVTTARPPPLWNPDGRSHRPPVITSVTALNATAVKVLWTQEEPVEATILYIIKRDTQENLKSTYVSSAEKSYVIGQLSPDTSYELLVKTFFKHGSRTASSDSVVFTTPAEGKLVVVTTPAQAHSQDSAVTPTAIIQASTPTGYSYRSTEMDHLGQYKPPGHVLHDTDLVGATNESKILPRVIIEPTRPITFALSPVLQTDKKEKTVMEVTKQFLQIIEQIKQSGLNPKELSGNLSIPRNLTSAGFPGSLSLTPEITSQVNQVNQMDRNITSTYDSKLVSLSDRNLVPPSGSNLVSPSDRNLVSPSDRNLVPPSDRNLESPFHINMASQTAKTFNMMNNSEEADPNSHVGILQTKSTTATSSLPKSTAATSSLPTSTKTQLVQEAEFLGPINVEENSQNPHLSEEQLIAAPLNLGQSLSTPVSTPHANMPEANMPDHNTPNTNMPTISMSFQKLEPLPTPFLVSPLHSSAFVQPNFTLAQLDLHLNLPESSLISNKTTTRKPGPDVHYPHKPVPTVKLYPTATTSTTTTPQPLRSEPTSHAAALPDFEHTMKPPEEIYEPTAKPTNEWIPSREYIPKPDHGNGVVDKFCEVTVHDGVTWPRTRFGKTEEKSCPSHLRGKSTWRCLGYGWENSGPDISECISPWLEDLVQNSTDVVGRHEPPANRDMPADEAADALCSKMRDRNMTSGDLNRTAMKLLPKLAQGIPRMLGSGSLQERKRKMKKFKKAFMESSSRLLGKRNSRSWRGLSKQNRRKSATSLIIAVEEAGFQSAGLIEQGNKEVDVDNNLVMQVTVLDTQRDHNDIRFPSRQDLSNSNWEGNSDSITIPSKSLKVIGIEAKGSINIVFTLYMNLEELIQPQWNTVSTIPSSKNDGNYNAGTISDGNGMDNTPALEINSKMISASIGSTKLRRRLVEPVRFTLEHLTATDNAVPVCSFWELDSSYLSGHWSQEGCKTLDTNSTHTTCECDHLTNFAILMDVTGTKLPEKHELALRVITFAGCVISIICLMLSWTTFMVFKNLQCDRNTIHKNLVLCLLLAEILFLGGIAQTEPKILCSIIAGALHYLFLGAFAWMCLEGVQLYVMLVEVFEQERSRVKWYYLFGYGIPAVVVAISAGVYYQGYGTARHCWLTTERAFIWSFVGPALAVMLINIVMLGIAIYTMCRHSNMSATMKERSKATKFSVSESLSSMETFASPKLRFPELPAWVKGAVVLVVLLGLTWLLGVLYLNEESVVIAYLFTALNSFQGMFIFVFHCIKNEKVQKEYRKVARRTSWLPNCIRVNYGGYTGVASSSPIPSSGSGHYLSKLFGQRRRSAASTNSSAKPFLSRDQHRRSDTENSSSRDSSMVPSSLNGYIYTPGQPNGKDHLAYKPSNGNGIITKNGPNQLTPCYESEGVVGDLSEYIDCSVVDSEFVSEYCRHNMQVSMEEKRYSTGSEDSKIIPATNNLRLPENDNLSTLSLASSSRKPASSLSSLETVGKPANDTSEYKLAGQFQKDGSDPRLNLHQYIIPNSRKIVNNNHLNVTNVHENDNKKRGVGELKSSSMNKLTKPAHSLTSIPETETSPQHSSTPNIQYRLGFGYADSHSDSAPSTAASSPDSVCNHQNIPIGIYEDLTPSSTMGSPSSIKSSLPNLEVLSIECDSPEIGCPKRRHSSETDIQFSPFRFTSTEC